MFITTRRAVLCLLLLAGTVAAPAAAVPASATAAPLAIDLQRATIASLQEALTNGTVTSQQLVTAYRERITRFDAAGPRLTAIRMLDPTAMAQAAQLDDERAHNRVRGPLHGIPVLIKDNTDAAGLPTTAGAIALRRSVPRGDAFLVQRLRAAGVIILGKTNLTEFANFMTNGMPSGYSGLGGQVRNPYNVAFSPSGSSSGSGAAAAAALAAVTLGTETSGSILSPAVANSLVGVKPTVGLVSRTGILPISSTQDTPGPMARSVSDAAALLTALTGIDPQDPATAASGPVVGTDYTRALSRTALAGARIGMTPGPGGNQGTAYNRAVSVLRAQGATVVPVTVNSGGLPPSILAYEFKRDLNAYLARLPAGAPMRTLDDIVRFNIANADQNTMRFGQTQLVQSNNINLDDPRLRATYEANRDSGIATARQRIDSVLRGRSLDAILFFGSGSAGIGARARYPSVAVPIGYDPSSGRPIGVSLLGTAFTEARLLALAFSYEQAARVWRPPPEVNP